MTGIQRIRDSFRGARTAFMPYAVLGYPTPAESLDVVRALVEAGADVLELGVPFSDPPADGPVIQAATQRALDNGVTLAGCLEMVTALRREGIRTPALLMGYVNPILAYGLEQFCTDAAVAGVDGLIVPDLPPDESEDLEAAAERCGMAVVHFLAPTSSPDRIELVVRRSRCFIYLVSVTGVTGVREGLSGDLLTFVGRVRVATDLALAVGFGIATGEQAGTVAAVADGVIVGSALVRRAGESIAGVRELAQELRAAIV